MNNNEWDQFKLGPRMYSNNVWADVLLGVSVIALALTMPAMILWDWITK